MEITYRKIDDLVPYVNNARTHNGEQVDQICGSIKEYGWTNPILIDDKNVIIAGHGRYLAGKKLGIKEVPCIVLIGLTEAQKKAYVIADNKMALNAGWDDEKLKLELENLKELDFDLSLTGFSEDEIDALGRNYADKLNDKNLQERFIAPHSACWIPGRDIGRKEKTNTSNSESTAETAEKKVCLAKG